MDNLQEHIDRVLDGLNIEQLAYYRRNGYKEDYIERYAEKWHINDRKQGRRFLYLDCGNSGAFLIEKATGELYNIQGYGKPDTNKKQKADIGNIQTVDPKVLFTKRYNYLR